MSKKLKKLKKRMGRVQLSMSYVVDLNDEDMVDEARSCLYEDLMDAFKYDEIGANIEEVEDKSAKESDIPEFLTGSIDEEE